MSVYWRQHQCLDPAFSIRKMQRTNCSNNFPAATRFELWSKLLVGLSWVDLNCCWRKVRHGAGFHGHQKELVKWRWAFEEDAGCLVEMMNILKINGFPVSAYRHCDSSWSWSNPDEKLQNQIGAWFEAAGANAELVRWSLGFQGSGAERTKRKREDLGYSFGNYREIYCTRQEIIKILRTRVGLYVSQADSWLMSWSRWADELGLC